MKTKLPPLHSLLFVFALLLGAYVRLQPALLTGFPVGDGGLFYAMTEALQKNGCVPPAFVEYNGLAIPFAYPPLGFYLAAALNGLFGIPLMEVFRWLPAVESLLFAALIYPLAEALLRSPFKALLATIFFLFLPRSIGWFVMGGGITRALGAIFLTLTLRAVYLLFSAPAPKYLALSVLFGGGVVLSHPELALHAATCSLALWAFFGRSRRGVQNALLVAFGILLTVSPFFGLTLARHGFAPYQHAAATGFHSLTAWLALLTGSFADEKLITLVSAFALLGLLVSLTRRDFLLPALWLIPALADPRSAASVSIIFWCMLAAIGFAEVVLPGFYALQNKTTPEDPLQSRLAKIVFSVILFYLFFGATVSNQVYLKISVNAGQRAAAQWTAENLPPRSRVLIITGQELAFADGFTEWYPALSSHVSAAAVQGWEWLPGKPFSARMEEFARLQACLNQGAGCVESRALQSGAAFEYVLAPSDSPLAESLAAAERYRPRYAAQGVSIYQKISQP